MYLLLKVTIHAMNQQSESFNMNKYFLGKKLLVFILAGFLALPVLAKKSSPGGYKSYGSSKTTNVHGYTKKDGTYVAPHHRTSPNNTQRDNWTSKPNQNPYTGKDGTKEPQR